MRTLKTGPWSDDELSKLREMYLEGMTDRDMSRALERTAGAVESKRSELRLIAKLFPDRKSKPQRFVGRCYTAHDNVDILTRYNNAESIEAIAIDYDVSMHAMEAKIERLLDSDKVAAIQATGRRCLWCGTWFFSKEPKRVRRRCDTCRDGSTVDTSFLTVY
jgi:hypothetical protein